MREKRAAMEMSVGTIVTIVLLVTVLILGIILIRSIFVSSQYNVNVLDQKIRGEIDKLFTEESDLVVYLANKKAEVKQGEDYGVAFGFKNKETGTTQAGIFSYKVIISNPTEVTEECGIDSSVVQGWMIGETESNIPVRPGEVGYGLVRFEIPETAPLCIIRLRIVMDKDGFEGYSSDFFDLKIIS